MKSAPAYKVTTPGEVITRSSNKAGPDPSEGGWAVSAWHRSWDSGCLYLPYVPVPILGSNSVAGRALPLQRDLGRGSGCSLSWYSAALCMMLCLIGRHHTTA